MNNFFDLKFTYVYMLMIPISFFRNRYNGRWVIHNNPKLRLSINIELYVGTHNKGLFHYVVANAFLKGFIVILYMSQSFYGLHGGSHEL